ncbi:MAG TPA: hypothetical protein VF518_05245, partial [Polyangia bacterium]
MASTPPKTGPSGNPLSLVRRAFLPNQFLARPFLLMLTAFWVALALIVWSASPWASLPGPREVLGA